MSALPRRPAIGLRRLAPNPILIKELRGRMRGPRAFLILTGFLLLLSGIAFFFYKTAEQAARWGGGMAPLSVMTGLSVFMGLAFFEMFLVAFITPALTAGTISGEREALTYEMLIATPLRPSAILLGKMVAALSYIFLLIFAAVPLLSLVFVFGGVTLRDVLLVLALLGVAAVTFGTLGLFWSALLGRTGRATVASYLTLLSLVAGPLVGQMVWGVAYQQTAPPAFAYINPFSAILSILQLDPNIGFSVVSNPLFYLFAGGMDMSGMASGLAHPAWHWTVALYSVLTLFLGTAALFLVRPIGNRRPALRQVLLMLLLVAATGAALLLAFDTEDWQQIWQTPDQGMTEDVRG